MNTIISLALSAFAGIGLGLFYFGGLWLTIRRLPVSLAAVPLFAVSFLLRAAAVVAGFYFVSGGRWDLILASLTGFMLVRLFAVQISFGGSLLHPQPEPPRNGAEKTSGPNTSDRPPSPGHVIAAPFQTTSPSEI